MMARCEGSLRSSLLAYEGIAFPSGTISAEERHLAMISGLDAAGGVPVNDYNGVVPYHRTLSHFHIDIVARNKYHVKLKFASRYSARLRLFLSTVGFPRWYSPGIGAEPLGYADQAAAGRRQSLQVSARTLAGNQPS